MFSSLVEFFAAEKKLTYTKKQRSSSLQGSLPTILFTTTCIDIEPLTPLITTDPINVPFTYHGHDRPYSSSLDSLSTSKSNSLASSSSSYGSPTTPISSSMSDDDGPLSLAFITPPPFMDQSSCGDMNRADHHQHYDKKHHSLAGAPKSIQKLAMPTKTDITKRAFFESIRHSLSLFMSPTFNSISWTVPSAPPSAPAPTAITTPVCDNVHYEVEEDHTITTTNPIHDDVCSHYPHHRRQSPQHPVYIRALRENPDHLRMIVSEVNMMRVNKLISPLRPRAILLERSDPFIPSTPSPLRHTV